MPDTAAVTGVVVLAVLLLRLFLYLVRAAQVSRRVTRWMRHG